MKVNLGTHVSDYAGQIVTENGNPVLAGVLIARFVALGHSDLKGDDLVRCLTLAARLSEGGEITLGTEEIVLILGCIDKNPSINSWVKAYIRYMLDPDGIPEDLRGQLDKIYAKKAT